MKKPYIKCEQLLLCPFCLPEVILTRNCVEKWSILFIFFKTHALLKKIVWQNCFHKKDEVVTKTVPCIYYGLPILSLLKKTLYIVPNLTFILLFYEGVVSIPVLLYCLKHSQLRSTLNSEANECDFVTELQLGRQMSIFYSIGNPIPKWPHPSPLPPREWFSRQLIWLHRDA